MLGVELRSVWFRSPSQSVPLSSLICGEHEKRKKKSLVKCYNNSKDMKLLIPYFVLNFSINYFDWKKILLTFFLNLFPLGISSWASNFSDSAVEPDAFVSNRKNHMGWKYCPNWVLFWGRYGNEVQYSDVTWNLV